ncbi:MAG: hypothetical protein LBB84_09915 [Tannerellaceae bacterium]|jgi:hypothetical protein|nr:hypothetical protein [Tannerellaceae bacterium]
MQLKTFSIIPIFFALSYLSECGDYYNIEPTAKTILGKWQEIARGNDWYPELEPDGHIIEFLPDGTMPEGTYHSGSFTLSLIGIRTSSYQIDEEFVYLNSGKPLIGYTYQYSFSGTDTLRMDLISGVRTFSMGTPLFNIYKRVK